MKSARSSVRPRISPRSTYTPLPVTQQETKLMLVPFRSGEAVFHHPDLTMYLHDGWSVRSATPRLVEGKGTQLLVVLAK